MNRVFTILFFVMAVTFFVAQAMPTEDNGDKKDNNGTLLGIDLHVLLKALMETLGISAEATKMIVKAIVEFCNGLLDVLDSLGNFSFAHTNCYHY